MTDELALLIARLLTHRVVARSDPLARRALSDDGFRQQLDERLAACGLRLLDNPYAAHLAVCLQSELDEPVMGAGESWLNNNLALPRDGVALLVVLWALIILPKRERQIARASRDGGEQSDKFPGHKPLATGAEVSPGVPEDAVYADFGKQLGGKTRFAANLGRLINLGFITRRNKLLYEGPLLDVLLDYSQLAPRILDGALGEVLARQASQPAQEAD